MKLPSLKIKMFLAVASLFVSYAAQAQYYTATDVVACQNPGANAAAGGIIAGAAGAVIGGLLGGGRGALIGGVTGGVVGAEFGAAASCTERVQYMPFVENQLNATNYQQAMLLPNQQGQVVVLASGYDMYHNICRTVHTEFYSWAARQWISEYTTACNIGGVWRYGYQPAIIVSPVFVNLNPPIRVWAVGEFDWHRDFIAHGNFDHAGMGGGFQDDHSFHMDNHGYGGGAVGAREGWGAPVGGRGWGGGRRYVW